MPGLLPPDWRRDPVAAGTLLAAATAALEGKALSTAPAASVMGVKSLVFTPDSIPFRMSSYPDAAGDYWNPAIGPAGASATGTGNSAVFACLGVLTKAFQEAPLRVFRTLADGTDDWLDEHPLMDLLADPHPSLSHLEFNSWLVWCLSTNGNAYLRKIKDRAGGVRQLWPISPALMAVETDEPDKARGVFISRYVYDDGAGHPDELAPEDVVHFRNGVDDADHRLGLSPLRRLLREVCSDEEATRFLEDLLRNFGVVSLAVTVPPGPVLTEEQATQIRNRLREDYNGTARNRGQVAVVGNGGTLQQVGFSPQQLDLRTAHYIPETRICAVLGVPPTLLNLASGLEHSIYNNVRQGQEHFYEQTVNPLWRQVAATYTKQLLWVDYARDKRVRLKYDTTDVRALQEDMNEVYARLSVAVEKGWVTKDEARAEVGLEPLPDGLGEAQDPIAMARELAEATGGPPGQNGRAPQGEEAEERARRALEQKAVGTAALPALVDTLETLMLPMVRQNLEQYLAGQHERVVAAAMKEAS